MRGRSSQNRPRGIESFPVHLLGAEDTWSKLAAILDMIASTAQGAFSFQT